jgi:hypothetical protein
MHVSARLAAVLAIAVAATAYRTLGFRGDAEPRPDATGAALPSVWRDPLPLRADTSIEYRNTKYRFCVVLPISWRGFSIVQGQWEGHATGSDGADHVIQRGPIVSIRHPRWTSADPRQDIPIMVFTAAQWRSLQDDSFHVSAAPIGPSELGQSRGFVFALPPRFDWAFPTGYEEVERILSGKPLHGDCPASHPGA